MIQSFYVGNLCEPDEFPSFQHESSREFVGFSSPFMDLERNVALFLGLFNHDLYKSLPIGHEELLCAKWTSASMGVLSGGLVNDLPLNTMTEEKVSDFKVHVIFTVSYNVHAGSQLEISNCVSLILLFAKKCKIFRKNAKNCGC